MHFDNALAREINVQETPENKGAHWQICAKCLQLKSSHKFFSHFVQIQKLIAGSQMSATLEDIGF